MKTISREELKQKLDRKENFRLVMALSEWAYQAKHIPSSLHFATIREALQSLNKDDEIVVYCSDENCIASTALGQLLERKLYPCVALRRWPAGLGAGSVSVRRRMGQSVRFFRFI